MSDAIVQNTKKLPPHRIPPDLSKAPTVPDSSILSKKFGEGDATKNRYQKLLSILLSKAVLSIFDQGLVSATSFVTSVLIGRLCGQDELGVYALTWSIVLFARGIQDNVIGAPYTVFCQRYKHSELHAYTGSTFAHQLILTAVSSAVLLLVVLLFISGGNAGDIPVAISLLGAFPLILIREHVRRLSIAHQDLKATIFIDGTVAVIQIGVLFTLGGFHLLTVPAVYGVMATACAIAFGGLLISGRYQFRMIRRQWFSDWLKNWSFARWALVTFLIGRSAPSVLPWIITLFCGVASTGLFAASMTIMGIGNVAVMGLTNLTVPRAAKALADGGISRLKQILPATLLMFAAPSLILCGIAAIGGKAIALFIYGPEFEAAGPIVTALYLWLLVNAIGIVAGSSLWAMERPDANLVADILVIVVTLSVTLLLVKTLGALGAACGMLCGASVGTIARWSTMLYLFHQKKPEPAFNNN